MGYMKKLLWAMALVVAIAGCKSPPSGAEGSLAWVTITNHTRLEITGATKDVFVRHGYKVARESPAQLTFEQPGSTWDNLEQGGWDSGVTVRVEAALNLQSDSIWLLHCRAWLVRHAGDSIIEDAHQLSRMKQGRYQKLLEEVRADVAAQ